MKELKPLKSENQRNDIGFPFNKRWGLTLWKIVGLSSAPNTDLDNKDLNRGAYLVETLGHCGTCHTPRNMTFVEKGLTSNSVEFMAGAVLDDWYVPDIRKVAGKWSDDLSDKDAAQLASFLRSAWNNNASAVTEKGAAKARNKLR